jgi:hypothetical protein
VNFELNRAINAEQDEEYAKALAACQNLDDLRALVTVYRELAPDAFEVVAAMTAKDWPVFLKGLKQERRGFIDRSRARARECRDRRIHRVRAEGDC